MADNENDSETPKGIFGLLASSLTPYNFPQMVGVRVKSSRKKRQRKKNERMATALAWRTVGKWPVYKQGDVYQVSDFLDLT